MNKTKSDLRNRLIGVHVSESELKSVEAAAKYSRVATSSWVRAVALEAAALPSDNRLKAQHLSDCAVNNAPAYAKGPCDCGIERLRRILNNFFVCRPGVAQAILDAGFRMHSPTRASLAGEGGVGDG